MKSVLYVCVLLFYLSGFVLAYAFEPIPITISSTMDKIIFDGKWTHETEWKMSSLDTYRYDDYTQMILRSAHQGDFVYIFLDAIDDYHPDKSDYAVICFDTKNNKATKADLDDYCFAASLDGEGLTYQGGATSETTDFFTSIPNHEEFIGKSTISDINDRYTAIPHPSYEFRIPTDLISRENIYGFYFLVYDDHSKRIYTYPQNLERGNFVSNPNQWGEIYSPDKSLPEFELPMISLVLSILTLVLFSKIWPTVKTSIGR